MKPQTTPKTYNCHDYDDIPCDLDDHNINGLSRDTWAGFTMWYCSGTKDALIEQIELDLSEDSEIIE